MDTAEPLPDWTIAASSTSTPRGRGVIGSVVSSAIKQVRSGTPKSGHAQIRHQCVCKVPAMSAYEGPQCAISVHTHGPFHWLDPYQTRAKPPATRMR